MSMLGSQADRLRDRADELRMLAGGMDAPYIVPSTKETMALAMQSAASEMREAADTIESLSDKLQGVMGTRYCELFGTPERTARTIVDREIGYRLMKCEDYGALLEWLRGDA